jgi:RNA polymerase sigma factor (TIGR02999 family)
MAQEEVTSLLLDWSHGDKAALERLTPLVYDELKRLAKRYLRKERSEHTLQSTALANEAFVRLIDQKQVEWQSRAHFFGVAAQMIRRILVDHARARRTSKRGGGLLQLSLDEALGIPDGRSVELIALDEALDQLSRLDEKQGRVVELRFFVGLSIEETAEVIGVSPTTVKREWISAKAWLFRELRHYPAASTSAAAVLE